MVIQADTKKKFRECGADEMDGAEVSGKIFEHLEHVSMKQCFFENCTFIRCKFTDTPIKGCRFVSCTFENCDLSVACLTGSSFRDVSFVECKAVGVNWSLTAGLHACNFISCKLSDSSFSTLDIRHILFQECALENADFRDARLDKGKFPHSKLSGAQFSKTNMTETDFSRAHDYFFDPRDNKLKKTKVSLPEAIGLLEAIGATLEA
jgi:uncharacterized protein YjbI with pentapeptide repeats